MIAYAITDPSILSFKRLKSDLLRIRSLGANWILYRDKSNPNYAKYAKYFISEAKDLGFEKIFLHNEIELALYLGADGVHLSSKNIEILSKIKEGKLFTLASTHNISEALQAQKLGANMITLSPLFASPNKGKPLKEKNFKEILAQLDIGVIALGGIIKEDEISQALKLGAKGFASIRYFS